jgi:hypothetical protein
MIVGIGNEAAQFHFWKNLFRIFGVQVVPLPSGSGFTTHGTIKIFFFSGMYACTTVPFTISPSPFFSPFSKTCYFAARRETEPAIPALLILP